MPLSIVLAFHGITASIVGAYQYKIGARASVFKAGLFFGGGFCLGALGIHLHSLPLLYLGYGFLGGIGIGMAYTPPLQLLYSVSLSLLLLLLLSLSLSLSLSF
jgi:hypothetical protein